MPSTMANCAQSLITQQAILKGSAACPKRNLLTSAAFMPCPTTRLYFFSGGKWLTQLLIRSRTTASSGMRSRYN